MQCKAKSKQSGEQCKRHAARGREVCKIHGGRTPTGHASPQFKTGQYSAYLPGRIRQRYQAFLSNPEAVETLAAIALLDSRIAELLERLQTGTDRELWFGLNCNFNELAGSFDSLIEAIEDAPGVLVQGVASGIESCRRVIREVLQSEAAWQELYDVLELRRKQVETQNKREKDMNQHITAEQALTLVSSLGAIIKTHVHDKFALAAIAQEFNQLTNRET